MRLSWLHAAIYCYVDGLMHAIETESKVRCPERATKSNSNLCQIELRNSLLNRLLDEVWKHCDLLSAMIEVLHQYDDRKDDEHQYQRTTRCRCIPFHYFSFSIDRSCQRMKILE